MKFTIPNGEKWVPVKAEVGEFEILVRRASAADRMKETAIRVVGMRNGSPAADIEAELQAFRIVASIADWRGVVEDGPGVDGGPPVERPVPFSINALDALCGAYGDVYQEVGLAAADAFSRTFHAEPVAGETGGN